MYTLTIVMLFLSCWIIILGSVLSVTKLRFVKNVTTFWFHNLPVCLMSYMLYNRHAASFSLIALKDFIFGGNLMKIGRSLSVSKLLRYASTISTWSTNNPNR